MQQLSNQEIFELKSRIDQIHQLLASRADTAEPPPGDHRQGAGDDMSRAVLIDQLSFNIQIRRLRKNHFGTAQMSGPIWDMMLDLMLASTHSRSLSASDLAAGADVPLSSGLRMIAALERLGLVRRSIDERDRRRSIVELTEQGSESMTSYFEKIGAAFRKSNNLPA